LFGFTANTEWPQDDVELTQTARHAGIALLALYVLQQMAAQFVSTEIEDFEPENRVYSIMEGEPKGKQCLHTIYLPPSSEVRPCGLLELNSIIFPSCFASSCTRSEFYRAF
jgi:hypothetical protein